MQQPSRFFWYELVTDKPKAAADFYAKVVGWDAKPYPGGPTTRSCTSTRNGQSPASWKFPQVQAG